jgi:hypothetical protein
VKFPSAQWRAYAPQSDLPQEPYWRAMHANAEELHRRVFREAFFVLAQSRTLKLSVCEAVSYAFRLLGRRISDFYGRERWPLAPQLYWKFQSALQQRRRVRGLAPQTPEGVLPKIFPSRLHPWLCIQGACRTVTHLTHGCGKSHLPSSVLACLDHGCARSQRAQLKPPVLSAPIA